MNETRGGILRARRQERGLSLNGLALKAGISKSTLSAWENDKAQPRPVELEAVFAALHLTAAERQTILNRMDAPRMARTLRQADEEAPPVGGDLLRAMRLRQNRTQQEVAAQIGVSQATLAKWERSDDWPGAERIHRLCFALQARPEELMALACGGFMPAPTEAKFDRDAFLRRMARTRHAGGVENEALRDLRFFSIEADLWRLSEQEAGAAEFLTGVYGEHAMTLAERGRLTEAAPYAERAMRRAKQGLYENDHWLPAGVALGRQLGQSRKHSDPAEAADFLTTLLPEAKSPERRGWLSSEIALYRAQAGDAEAALAWSEQGCRLAESSAWRGEYYFRRCDRAKVLMMAGRLREAQALCLQTLDGPENFASGIPSYLLLTEAHLALAEPDEAQIWLARAETLIQAHDLRQHRPQAQSLRAALAKSKE